MNMSAQWTRNSEPAATRRTGQVLNREDLSRNTEQARVPSTWGTAPETHLSGKQRADNFAS
jgi:hypothetical protein